LNLINQSDLLKKNFFKNDECRVGSLENITKELYMQDRRREGVDLIKNIYILHETEGTLFEKNYGEKNICFELFSNFLVAVSTEENGEIGFVYFEDFVLCYLVRKPILVAVISSKTSQCTKDFLQRIYSRFVRKYRDFLDLEINQRQVFSDFESDVTELVKQINVPLQII